MNDLVLDILSRCNSAGISTTLQGDKLKIASKSKTPDMELITLIKSHKADLIAYLTKLDSFQDDQKDGPITISPYNRDEITRTPLSFGQKRLWFIDHLEPGNPQYNIPGGLLLTGSLDVTKFEESFIYIVNRHEVLRTVYDQDDQGVKSMVQAVESIDMPVVDMINFSPEEQQSRIKEYLEEEAKTAFDLSQDLMLRLKLLRLSEEEHALLFCMHHIAADGWSMGVLVKELGQAYASLLSGTQIDLPALSIQYSDYAHWQSQHLEGEMLSNYRLYWDKQLTGIPAVHDLPLDFARTEVRGSTGRRLRKRIPKKISDGLRHIAQDHDCTLFMVLQSAFSVFLGRHGRSEDVVMGTPIANREQGDISSLIGFFVNTLVLRSDLSGNPAFKELLARNKSMLLEAYAHQQMPFEQLVEVLQPERSMSYSPLFQVLFALQNNEVQPLELPNLELKGLDIEVATTKFDLSLNVFETEEGLLCHWEYATSLFSSATIERFADRFELMLEAIVADASTKIHELPLLIDAENEQITLWNKHQVEADSDHCIHELFEAQVIQNSDRIALTFEDTRLTYRELNERANQLAHYLKQQRDINPDDLVGICLSRSLEMVISILAVLKSGGAYVPLDPNYPEARLKYMITDADLKTVIVSSDLVDYLKTESELLIDPWSNHELANYSIENIAIEKQGLEASHLAYVIYTSGSTGKPKGVMVEHRQVTRLFRTSEEHFKIGSDDVWSLFHSFAFDFSVWEIWGALLYGGKSVIVPKWVNESTSDFYKLVEREGVTVLNQTPSAFTNFIQVDETEGGDLKLKYVIFGGEALVPSSLKPWIAKHGDQPALVNMYGITETTVHVTYQLLDQESLNSSQSVIGVPLSDLKAEVLDAYGRRTPIGVPGELHVGGAGVTRGYLDRPELTEKRFIPDPFNSDASARLYKTGDEVKCLPDGRFMYLGRIDHQVKLRGFRIELGEVADVLSRHELVNDAVVTLHEHQHLVGYVAVGVDVASEGLIEKLRIHAGQELPEYMVPTFIIALEQLPLTSNGKVDRKALLPPDVAEMQQTYVAPATKEEQVLADIWATLLEIDQIGVQDNFFHLGGHSLMIIQVINRLKFNGLQVTAQDVFANPVLKDLARQVQAYKAEYVVPENLIPEGSEEITLEMLPLVDEISNDSLQSLMALIPGGASNVADIYPLAPLQEGMLFHNRLEIGDKDPYIIPYIMSFDNLGRREEFITALQAVIDRHDVLKTSYHWEGLEEPLQVVQRKAKIPLKPLELEVQDGESVLDVLKQRVYHGGLSMDLTQAPAMHLYEVADKANDANYMVLLWHHIMMDHIGMRRIIQEVAAHYTGEYVNLPKPALYREFVGKARYIQSHTDYLSYFKPRLESIEEPTLCYDFSDINLDGGELLEGKLLYAIDQSNKLREQCRKHEISPAALFHAAWGIVVGRTSGAEEQVLFGTVLSGRLGSSETGSSSLGLYINTLPICLQVSKTVKDFVKHVYEEITGLVDYEQVPLTELKGLTQLKDGHIPLFNSLINYRHSFESGSDSQQEAPDQGIQMIGAVERNNYPLALHVNDLGDQFRLTVHITDLIGVSADTIIGYVDKVVDGLLNALDSSDEIAVGKLDMISEEEHQLLDSWNDTAVAYQTEKVLHQLFEEKAVEYPDKIAVTYEGQHLTYRQLNEQSNQLAHYLISKGVRQESPVAFCMDRSLEMVIGVYAILKAGGACVPISQEFPQNRIDFMLEDTKAALVLSHSSLHHLFTQNNQVEPVFLDQLTNEVTQQPCEIPKMEFTPEQLFYVIYTSGSTGKPKGVMLTYGMISNLIHDYFDRHPFGPDDVYLFKSPFVFDASIGELFGWFMGAGKLSVLPPGYEKEDVKIATHIQEHGITHINFVPSFFNLLLAHLEETGTVLASLKYVFESGEAMQPASAHVFRKSHPHCELWNIYGPTETHVCTTYLFTGEEPGSIPIGSAIANTNLYVLNSHRQRVPVGVPGELCIGGAGVSRGYLNRPDLSNERYIQNPFNDDPYDKLYRSGDLVRMLPDGNVDFLARIDHQVKLRGFRIELDEVAAVLSSFDGVQDAVVILHDKSHLVGYVAVGDSNQLLGDFVDVIISHAKKNLPDYMVPSFIVLMDQLPLTSNGKVNRRALPAYDISAMQETYVAPTTVTEKQLVKIWEALLGVEQVGLYDNFFHLGGHSLMVLRLINQLKNVGFELAAHEVFKYPELKAMAEQIDQSSHNDKRDQNQMLINMNGVEKGKPLFLVPEISGDAFQYNELVKHIQVDGPIYGIDGSALNVSDAELQSVENLARFYIKEIQKVQPQGPYKLLGWSFGGHVAYEMSKQLVGMDREVAYIGMIDTNVSNKVHHVDIRESTRQFLGYFLNEIGYKGQVSVERLCSWLIISDSGNLMFKSDSELPEDILGFFDEVKAFDYDRTDILRRISMANVHMKLGARYFVQKFHLPVHHYIAELSRHMDASLTNQGRIDEIKSVLGEKATVLLVEGSDHGSILKDPPYASQLGQLVSQAITDKVTPATEITTSRNAFEHQPIISFQTGRREVTRLYCIPGAGGAIGGLIQLTNYFDDKMPISGVIPRGLEDDAVPHKTVEATASYYIEKINPSRPPQSFNLLGHSYGGWVAIEMAHQLVAKGHTVESVVLLDSAAPVKEREPGEADSRLYSTKQLVKLFELQSSKKFSVDVNEMLTWPEMNQMETILTNMKGMEIIPNSASIDDVRRMVQLFTINATAEYTPARKYDGRVLLVQAADQVELLELDEDIRGWQRHITNLEVAKGKGNHMTMLENPAARDLAANIEAFILNKYVESE